MLLYKVRPIRNFLKLTRYNFNASPFNANKDYYKTLGLEKTATDAQIKAAFYKLAKKYHPDHNKGSEALFKEINEAYTVLSHPETKREYQNARNFSQQSSAQNPFNYNYNQNSQYQQQYRNPYENQYQRHQSSNPYSQQNYQWTQQQQRQRASFGDAYSNYEKFQQEYMKKHRMRQNQQFNVFKQEYQRGMKRVVKASFIFSLLLFFIILYSPKNNRSYYEQQNAPPPGYRLVNIRGTPFLQKQNDLDYAYDTAYGSPYNQGRYGSAGMPGPETRRY